MLSSYFGLLAIAIWVQALRSADGSLGARIWGLMVGIVFGGLFVLTTTPLRNGLLGAAIYLVLGPLLVEIYGRTETVFSVNITFRISAVRC